MARKRQLSQIEIWAASQKRGDVPDLIRRIVVKLKDPSVGYIAYIDGIEIVAEDSPSRAKKRAVKILERHIKTPGSSGKVEGDISLNEIAGIFRQVPAALVEKFQSLERYEKATMPKRAFNKLLRSRGVLA
jgi:hypothetical protein